MGNDLAGKPDFPDLVGRKLMGNLIQGKLAGTCLRNLVGRFSGELFFWIEIGLEI